MVYTLLGLLAILADVPAAVRGPGVAATVRLTDPVTGAVGTGCVVGRRGGYVYVLTAAHVIGPESRPRLDIFPAGRAKDPVAYERCDVVFRATEPDLAVVRMPAGDADWAPAPLAPAPGGRAPDGAWSVGCNGGKAPSLERVRLKGRKLVRRPDGSSAFFWEVGGASAAGRSGGPLLDNDGRVIGVCSGTQGGKTYFAHPDEIRAACRTHRLGWLVGESGGK